MFDDLPNDDQPEREDAPRDDNQLEADAEWAADQLQAYQLEFEFIEGEDAAAVGELARFSAPVPLIGVLAMRVLLPRASRAQPDGMPPLVFTIYPERIVARAYSGGIIREAQAPLPRRSAVRASGIAFSLDTRAAKSLFGGQGKRRLNWREQEVVQWRLVGKDSEKDGFLSLSAERTHLHLKAEELISPLSLPAAQGVEFAPVNSLDALRRSLSFADAFPPKQNRFGVIEVRDGVARAGSWDALVEYSEPGLNAFDLALPTSDIAPAAAVLRSLRGNVRFHRENEKLIFNSAEVTALVRTTDVTVPKLDAARENARAGVKISLSTFELFRSVQPMLAASRTGNHVVKFELRADGHVTKLVLIPQTSEARGESTIGVVPAETTGSVERAFVAADALVTMVDPRNFDAAELFLGSDAGMVSQFRGEASLTYIFSYVPPL